MNFSQKKISLFGSYAYGNPQNDSDVYLLVILPYKRSNFRKNWEILNKVKPNFAIDLLVRTLVGIEQQPGMIVFCEKL